MPQNKREGGGVPATKQEGEARHKTKGVRVRHKTKGEGGGRHKTKGEEDPPQNKRVRGPATDFVFLDFCGLVYIFEVLVYIFKVLVLVFKFIVYSL